MSYERWSIWQNPGLVPWSEYHAVPDMAVIFNRYYVLWIHHLAIKVMKNMGDLVGLSYSMKSRAIYLIP